MGFPLSSFKHVNQAVKEMVRGYLQIFGSVGKA